MLINDGENFAWNLITNEAKLYSFILIETNLDFNPLLIDSIQGDFNETNTTAASYIKNKPFYESTETLWSGAILVDDEEGGPPYYGTLYNWQNMDLTFLEDMIEKDIEVVLNNKKYTAPCSLQEGYIVIGDAQKVMNATSKDDFEENEFPAALAFNLESSSSFVGEFIGFLDGVTADNNFFIFNLLGTVIHKMSSKFIEWDGGNAPSSLPEVTEDDNDKVLIVVNGQWQVGSIANGDEVAY